MSDVIAEYILTDSGFFKNFLYQGGVKSTVSWVFEKRKMLKSKQRSTYTYVGHVTNRNFKIQIF